ncbi:protoporphyrinogen/coproporphyrinogen oxidase [Roseateles sp.]|uniref:protoporphyrinogen/coproporphyrinogen oxidase n=1 Tax=Roseateles sp. TaxID=1971397 RepID=UPI003BA6CC3E
MSIEHVHVAILGAGIAGLGAAHRANQLGLTDVVVFEARSSAGGLLDNFTLDGFRFDHAVHLSFASEPEVREVFDRAPYLTHPADAKCHESGRWLKHPVQNNLYPLPADEKVALVKSFLDRPAALGEADYESWLRHQYGDAIANRYPIRYTRKYWDTPACDLSTTWVGNRMRRAELDEILHGAFTDETPNYYYTKEMRYPERGGFKAFIQPLIDASNIRLNHRIQTIDTTQKVLSFDNGRQVSYDLLVSSLPLPVLATLCTDVPESVRESAGMLRATSLDLVSVAFNKPLVKDLWFYIYDGEFLASRAYSPSVKSPENAPAGCSSLQFEIYARGTESAHTPEEVVANTRLTIKRLGIAKDSDILFTDHRRLPYGNVIFDLGMEARRDKVLAWCEQVEIRSCGRFGRWDYLWSNQSFLSGYHSLDDAA